MKRIVFNNVYAIVLTILIFAYIFLTTFCNIKTDRIADLAIGVLLAKFSDIVQFFFRKAPENKSS